MDHDLVAVIGLARSGRAVTTLLARQGRRVYASDAGDTSELRATAAGLRDLGVQVELGGHNLALIARAACVVVSPGVPPEAPPLQQARQAGVPVVSEVSVALESLPRSRVIAVTGTNGKSTVTALIAHLLCATGRRAEAAGNIGRAVAEVALEEMPPDWIVLEVSSFQLHDMPRFSPLVGVLTNLSPDHLDRYSSAQEYYADKQRIFAAATNQSLWVTNADDAGVLRLSAGARGAHYRFSVRREADAWYDAGERALYLLGEHLCARDDVRLLGEHNIANALAAALAVVVANGRDMTLHDRLRAGVKSFTGLPHRLERVDEVDGVLWINDSKATNVESARVAIEAMARPTVLLLGGRHKGKSYTELAEALRRRIRLVLAYGEAGAIIQRDLAGVVPLELLGSDFTAVVERARQVARPGEAVLLAPACSSYDMFRDYEERGDRFRMLVHGQ